MNIIQYPLTVSAVPTPGEIVNSRHVPTNSTMQLVVQPNGTLDLTALVQGDYALTFENGALSSLDSDNFKSATNLDFNADQDVKQDTYHVVVASDADVVVHNLNTINCIVTLISLDPNSLYQAIPDAVLTITPTQINIGGVATLGHSTYQVNVVHRL